MKKYFNQRAFTLIEIMIVLAIISILVLLIIPNAIEIVNSANDTGCEAITSSNNALSIAKEVTGVDEQIPPASVNRVCGSE